MCCLYPGCEVKPFRRCSDLIRHYQSVHTPDALKESYACDYMHCARRKDPFRRLDHFREHLREFHKEDIRKRGREDKVLAQGDWWRCARCLKRVYGERRDECEACQPD